MNEAHFHFWAECCPQKSNEPDMGWSDPTVQTNTIASNDKIIIGCGYNQNKRLNDKA